MQSVEAVVSHKVSYLPHLLRGLEIAGDVYHESAVGIIGPVLDYGAGEFLRSVGEQAALKHPAAHSYGLLRGSFYQGFLRSQCNPIVFRIVMADDGGLDRSAGFETAFSGFHAFE